MENNTNTNSPAFTVRERRGDWRDRASKPRLYANGFDTDAPTGPVCTDLECGSGVCNAARRAGKPENCEVDHKVWKAWLKQGTKAVREAGIPLVASFLGADPAVVKLYFSSKAGCSCGCSPGFIVDSTDPVLKAKLSRNRSEDFSLNK